MKHRGLMRVDTDGASRRGGRFRAALGSGQRRARSSKASRRRSASAGPCQPTKAIKSSLDGFNNRLADLALRGLMPPKTQAYSLHAALAGLGFLIKISTGAKSFALAIDAGRISMRCQSQTRGDAASTPMTRYLHAQSLRHQSCRNLARVSA